MRAKPLLVLVLILAGCGGSGNGKWAEIHGRGFTFDAPSGWSVSGTAASSGSIDRVEVQTFELEHPYRRSKRAAVAAELDRDSADLAKQLKGTVTSKTATRAGGLDAWTYGFAFDGKVEQITFAFRAGREYELLCRYAAGASASACTELVSSFRLA